MIFQKILQLIIWKETGLKGSANFFSVDFDPNDTNDISINISWKKHKIIVALIKKIFTGVLTSIVSASTVTKCVLLSDPKCMTEPSLTNSHPNEYSQELHYYPFPVKLDRCVGICNALNDSSTKAYVPNRTEHLNLSCLTWLQE